MSSQATHTEIPGTSENEKVLEDFWNKGMTFRASELVDHASRKTGLSTKDVKVWITNKNKRAKRASDKENGIQVKRVKKSPVRAKRGYDLFLSYRMLQEDLSSLGLKDQGKKLQIAQAEWKLLPDSEKEWWNQKAASQPSNIEHSSIVSRKLLILQANCKELWGLGLDVTLLIPPVPGDARRLRIHRPPHMDEFWDERADATLLQELGAELDAESAADGSSSDKESDRLRKEIQQIFNEGYEKATGKKHRFRYTQLDKGNIIAHGLPEGVTMKRPGQYVEGEKKAIIENASSIWFEVITPREAAVPETLAEHEQGAATMESMASIQNKDGTMVTEGEKSSSATLTMGSKPTTNVLQSMTEDSGDVASIQEVDTMQSYIFTVDPHEPVVTVQIHHNNESDGADKLAEPMEFIESSDNQSVSSTTALSLLNPLASGEPRNVCQEAGTSEKVLKKQKRGRPSKRKASSVDFFVGKTFEHLWRMADGEPGEWYRGTVLKRTEKYYHIKYLNETSVTRLPTDGIHQAFKDGTLVLATDETTIPAAGET